MYPNLAKYIKLLQINDELNYKHLSDELRYYFKELQNVIPYSIYKALLEKMNDTAKLEEYYLALSVIAKEYTPKMSNRYPELNRFFEYIRLNYAINPISLTLEERSLTRNITRRYAKKQLDKEVLFLSEMGEHFKNYLDLKITNDELEYFSKNKKLFKALLWKYLDNEEIAEAVKLIDDDKAGKFYQTNIDRDQIFVDAITTAGRRVEGRKVEGSGSTGSLDPVPSTNTPSPTSSEPPLYKRGILSSTI
ncbi:MAG: hypothetical protein AABX51_08920, partial [Nanoarchaeota archaeon]